jgi:outer membrane protein
MKRNGTILALAAAFAVTTTASAQMQTSTAASEAHIQDLMRQAAERLGIQAQTAQPPAAAQGATPPTVRLTLDDAVKLALDRNLDIAVQRLNPQINDIAIASVSTIYHPSLTSTIGPQSTTILPTSQTSLGTNGTPSTDTLTFTGGIAQSIPWGGGSFNANLVNFKRTSSVNNSLYNPLFQSTWTFGYIQPLLRNFSIDSTRQQLAVTKLNRDISDVQLRATITNTLSNVRNAYWDYVFAVQSVDVAQQSLDLANKLVQDNQTRVEVGTMAPIDVITAQSQAATAKQNLVGTVTTKRTAELTLKRLIVSGTNDPNWNATLDPVDRPDFQPETFDLQAAVRRALDERTDIAIAKKTVEENDVTLKFLGDQMKPQVDLQASYGLQGLGGTQLERSAALGGQITQSIPGGLGDTFNSLFRNAYPTWSAQLVMSYPLGLSSQQANVARARVQLGQVQAQLQQAELQVATDVTNAVVTAQSNAERVQAAQVARELAQKTMEAEQSKFEVGMSTNYNVILTQRDLATAQINELQAIANYRKSLVEVERLQQTTLTNLNITVLSSGGGTTTTRAGS